MSTGTYSCVAGLLSALFVAAEVPCQTQDDHSPHTERFVEIDQVTLHVLDWGGSGPDMVFLPGFGDTAHAFDSIAARFRSRFRVVAMTRRGVAPSSRPARGYDQATLTADVLHVLDALEIRAAHLVGHSMAGVEMTELARQYPARVLSLVYLDAAIDAVDAARVMRRDPMIGAPAASESPSGQIDAWWNTYSPTFSVLRSPSLAFFAVQSRHPYVPADASETTRQRADAYWATEATPLVERMAAKFRREANGGEVVVLTEASHHLYRDREADVVARMNEFYNKILK
jgi:pimeloyl-ACP methyl ester carboxylesterase